jgi:hypothetical protein
LFVGVDLGVGFEFGVGLFDFGAVDEGFFDFLRCFWGGYGSVKLFLCVIWGCGWKTALLRL